MNSNILIAYSSITGNNEKLSNHLNDFFIKNNFNVILKELEYVEDEDVSSTDTIIIVPYTYDNGSEPFEFEEFFENLKDSKINNINFAVIGSGDDFYGETYGKAVDTIDQKLSSIGLKRINEPTKINLKQFSPQIDSFEENIIEQIKNPE